MNISFIVIFVNLFFSIKLKIDMDILTRIRIVNETKNRFGMRWMHTLNVRGEKRKT